MEKSNGAKEMYGKEELSKGIAQSASDARTRQCAEPDVTAKTA